MFIVAGVIVTAVGVYVYKKIDQRRQDRGSAPVMLPRVHDDITVTLMMSSCTLDMSSPLLAQVGTSLAWYVIMIVVSTPLPCRCI